MKLCTTCGQPLNRGGTPDKNTRRCIVCLTADILKDWQPPVKPPRVLTPEQREAKNLYQKRRRLQTR